MIPAQQAPWNCVVPQWVKTKNNEWLNYSHYAWENGTYGGFGYTGPSYGDALTPSGMVQLDFVGATTADPRWVRTERWFADAWGGWLNSYNFYAYYAFAKAMRLALPQPVATFSHNGFDWYRGNANAEGLAKRISDGLIANHAWGSPWADVPLATAWSVIILRPVLFQEAPIACFTAQPNPNYANSPIEFDPSCSDHSDPAKNRDNLILFEWDWDSDGVFDEASTGPEVRSHAFSCLMLPCVQPVTLRVTDDVGNQATYRQEIHITNPPHPPVARIKGPFWVSLCADDSLTLDATDSFDVDAGEREAGCLTCPTDVVTAWNWDLNGAPFAFDGPSGALVNLGPDFRQYFPTPGTYDIGVRVFDNTALAFPGSGQPNLSDDEFTQVIVFDQGVCHLNAVAECQGAVLNWDDVPGALFTVWVSPQGANTGFREVASTQENGITISGLPVGVPRWIRITAQLPSGLLMSEPVEVVAEAGLCAPLADAGGPYQGCAGQSVTLTAAGSTAPLGQIVSWEWDLDNDGQYDDASGETIQHTFAAPGNYPIRVKVAAASAVVLVGEAGTTVKVDRCGCIDSLVARAKLDKIQLVWKPESDALSYNVHRSTTPWFTPSEQTLIAKSVSTTYATYLDENLPLGVSYFYRVVKVGVDGQEVCASNESGDTTRSRGGNVPPAANAGPDQIVAVGDTVRLDGTGSFDANGNRLNYQWRLVKGPVGSQASLNDNHDPRPTFVADVKGAYTYELIVNDTLVNSAPDTVTIKTQNTPPEADPGSDFTVTLGALAQLDGSKSSDPDGDLLTYRWLLSRRPDASDAVLDDPTALKPTFVVDAKGEYEVTLIVNDGIDESFPATQTIVTINTAPVARATADQLIPVGLASELDGSGSSDGDGDPLTYRWTLVAAPAGSTATVGSAQSVKATLTPDRSGEYQVQLVVSDGQVSSVPSVVTLSANGMPIAIAGDDQLIRIGDRVQLDGSRSSDPEGASLSFLWTFVQKPAGSRVAFSNGSAVAPTFVVDLEGEYVAQLIVGDGLLESLPDTVKVVVGNRPPEITSLPRLEAVPGEKYGYPVEAADPDGDFLLYELLAGPTGSAIDPVTGEIEWLVSASPGTTHPFEVRVTDQFGAIDEQKFLVAVVPAPDLRVTRVNPEGLAYDAQCLTAFGTVEVTLENGGAGGINRPFEVLLFEDRNGNSRYDSGIDSNLGSTRITRSLTAGESQTVTLAAAGEVLFSQNLVWAYADSAADLLESDEANNVGISVNDCLVQPIIGQFNPVFEWTKQSFSELPSSTQIMMTPSVIDLDGDGVPEIVVGTTPSLGGGYVEVGSLRAVRGDTGAEVFTVTDSAYRINTASSIAVGDIDDDGKPEIIACDESGYRLIAFEHDGTFKWRSADLEPINWGAPALADLNHDGSPEIIVGRQVLDSSGRVLWTGTGGRGSLGAGPLALVTDLDMDGNPEIVAGNTAYSSLGSTVWQSTSLPDGLNAVGNFNASPFPEVVLVSGGQVWLLDHLGQVIWGPVGVPGGGGGPPTVADFDGDGQPEIGVAGASRFVVFEGDGSILWLSTTQDSSSQVTAASVFDFDGDGSAEVVYRDELKLRIYRGIDGQVLYEVPMSSCTWHEYVVVADVDADGNAEIVAVANQNCGFGPQTGLYVIGDRDDTWVSTRKIWNQHTYHIDNINDDGSVPKFEANSWLSHNSYRLNALPTVEESRQAPDLLAAYLVTGKKPGGGSTLSARIANVGSQFAPVGVSVAFYEGNPAAGGNLLGVVTLPEVLQVAAYSDISLDVNGLPGDIWVVADDDGTGRGRVRECNEENNTHHPGAGYGPGNTIPLITSQPIKQAKVGVKYQYPVQALDPDAGATLTYSLRVSPEAMEIDPLSGLISWTPKESDTGALVAVEVVVTDNLGASDCQLYQINVGTGGNALPVITSVPSLRTFVGQLYSYVVEASDPDNDELTTTVVLGPEGMTFDAASQRIDWTPRVDQVGEHIFIVEVTDPQGGADRQLFVVHVRAPNAVPIANAGPDLEVNVGQLVAVNGTGSSDADGDPLVFAWVLMQKPTGSAAALDNPQSPTPKFTADLPGTYVARLIVHDGFASSAPDEVQVTTANRPPIANAGTGQAKFVGDVFQLGGAASADPDGDSLTYEWTLTLSPIGSTAAITNPNTVNPTFIPDVVGLYQAQLRVSDGRGGSSTATVNLTAKAFAIAEDLTGLTETEARQAIEDAGLQVGQITLRSDESILPGIVLDQNPPPGIKLDVGTVVDLVVSSGPDVAPPTVTVAANPVFNPVGGTVVLTVTATDDGLVTGLGLKVNGVPVALQGNQASFVCTVVGAYQVEATAEDAVGNIGYGETTFYATDPSDTTPPTVVITAPADDSSVTALTEVRGSVFDPAGQFASYTVEVAPVDQVDLSTLESPAFKAIGQGTTEVHDGTLAMFDPTLLQNDAYVVRVSAWDQNGQGRREYVIVNVSGNLKLGNFRLEFTDLVVPVAGIPITITRVYDTLQAQIKGDFGYGWRLGLRDARIVETKRDIFGYRTFYPGTRVYINTPDGRRVGFTAYTRQAVSFGFTFVEVGLRPDPGVYEKLQFKGKPEGQLNAIYFQGAYLDGLADQAFDPNEYVLTAKDGTTYEYSQSEGLQKITDLNGNHLEFTSSGIFHHLSGQATPDQQIQFIRDAQGRIEKVIDPAGNPLTYTYDPAGDLRSFANQVDNLTQYSYHPTHPHYLGRIIDPLGREAVNLVYDTSGRVERVIDANGNALNQTFDSVERSGTYIDARGYVSQLLYDERGNIVEYRNPEGGITRYEYSDPENPDSATKITNPIGQEQTLKYNSVGNLIERANALGAVTFEYNSAGSLLRVTDALGHSEYAEYDSRQNITAAIDRNGNRTTYAHNSSGVLTKITEPSGTETTLFYDAGCNCGNPSLVVYGDGSKRRFEYDQFGRMTLSVDETGAESRFAYDRVGRLLYEQDHAGNQVTYEYAAANVIKMTDRLGRVTRYEYDSGNQPISELRADGGVIRYTFDAVGNLTSVTDGNGRLTRFEYDGNNRLRNRIDPAGKTTTVEYDLAGNRTALVDRLGRKRTFTYNEDGRVTSEIWLGQDGTALRSMIFNYDVAGRMLSATDPDSNLIFEHDVADRLTRVEQYPSGFGRSTTLNYSYGPAGERLQVRDDLGISVASHYDKRGRPLSHVWTGSDTDGLRVEYSWDERGQRTRIRRFSSALGASPASQTLVSEIDPRGWIRKIEHLDSNESPLPETRLTYDYDDAGQVVFSAGLGDSATYSYDSVGQLSGVDHTLFPDEKYSYDLSGNRLLSSLNGAVSLDTSGRTILDAKHSYEYDAEGNLTKQTTLLTGDFISLSWDYRNRLTAVQQFAAGQVNPLMTINYAYDVFNRRVKRQENNTATFTIFDGDNRWRETEEAGPATRHFFHGLGLDELLAVSTSGTVRWPATDRFGTVVAMMDRDGNLIRTYRYDSFGNSIGGVSAGADELRAGFTGRELDGSSLYYFRSRYYDPQLGQFISEDPLGMRQGEWNLRAYARSNPLFYIDPTGQTAFVQYIGISTSGGQEAIAAFIGFFHGFGAANLIFVGEVLGLTPEETLQTALQRAVQRTDDLTCLLKRIAGVAETAYELGKLPKGVAGIAKGFVSGAGFTVKFEDKKGKGAALKIFGDVTCLEQPLWSGGPKAKIGSLSWKVGGFSGGAAFGLSRIAGLIDDQ